MSEIQIVRFDEFVGVEEPHSEPLLGTRDETLLPAGGRLLMYRDGGAGKTTLTVDAIAHLAAGIPWLGIDVPRPMRFLVIENEGPRGKFREKLGEKKLDWRGPRFTDNVFVLDEPWAAFTFTNPDHTNSVSAYITQHEIDVLVAGPLGSLGTIGGGTPDQVEAFVQLLNAMKAGTEYAYAEWLIHHENKAGAISGAWNRVPDTLVHVSGQHNGRTRVHWEKARWASTFHHISVSLAWTDGKSFAIEHEKEARDYRTDLVEAFTADDQWRTAAEIATLISGNKDKCKEHCSTLVSEGVMVYKQGPSGRSPNAKCWRLSTGSDTPSHHEPEDPSEGPQAPLARLALPVREASQKSQQSRPERTGSGTPSHQNHPSATGRPE